MKKVLLPITLVTLLSVLIYSCSSDDDDPAPPSVIQTPEPETPAPTPTQYTLTVSAKEGGTVSSEGGTYDEGTEVSITANPNEGYVFNGWSNGSNINQISITLDGNKTIEPDFITIMKYFELSFCNESSLLSEGSPNNTTDNFNKQFRPFYDYNSFIDRVQYTFTNTDSNGLVFVDGETGSVFDESNHFQSFLYPRFLDINNNSIPDLVLVASRIDEDVTGEVYVIIDNVLTHRFNSGQAGTRRLLVGDIDKNGSEDIVLINTGIDNPPYTGAITKIVYFTPSTYEIKTLDNDPSYYHGGCIGDVNNDNNLDILVVNNQGPEDTFIYLGNGDKTFEKKSVSETYPFHWRFNHKFYDVNNDGNLDLISGGDEWPYLPDPDMPYRTAIYFGNGDGSFDFENPTNLPEIDYWGLINDFAFSDLDGDGEIEIIVNRATGHEDYSGGVENNKNYDGLKIQILKKEGDEYINHQILDQPDGWFEFPTWIEWIPFIQLFDVNGDCLLDIVPDYEGLSNPRFNQLSRFWGLYYRAQPGGTFVLDYFDPSNPKQ